MQSAYETDPGVQWMLAYQSGSEEDFDRIVEAYSGRVYSLLTRFRGPVPEREDLVQEVFLRVIRARERYQPTARFGTWLYRITFNLCVNETERSSGRLTSLQAHGDDGAREEEPADLSQEGPSQRMERAAVVAAVRSAIAALPENQRMALILAKYDDQPYSEIAAVLESSEKAVKSLIHRARETLRARLHPYMQREET